MNLVEDPVLRLFCHLSIRNMKARYVRPSLNFQSRRWLFTSRYPRPTSGRHPFHVAQTFCQSKGNRIIFFHDVDVFIAAFCVSHGCWLPLVRATATFWFRFGFHRKVNLRNFFVEPSLELQTVK